jgi:hypothetical protein
VVLCSVADHGSSLFGEFVSALEIKAETGYTLKLKFRSFKDSKWSHWGPWRLKMESWRVFKPVVGGAGSALKWKVWKVWLNPDPDLH